MEQERGAKRRVARYVNSAKDHLSLIKYERMEKKMEPVLEALCAGLEPRREIIAIIAEVLVIGN